MASVAPRRWERPEWIASHVAEQIPPGVMVTVRVSPAHETVDVSLRTRWWRHRRTRRRILVQAVMASSDSPAGVRVRTRWA